MKTLCLFLLVHATLQLKCDKTKIAAHIGDQITVICSYDKTLFRGNKKYWCQGESRYSCEILADSDGLTLTANSHRYQVKHDRGKGLIVKVTNVQVSDTGRHWVGIEKVFDDIMTSVDMVVTEEPVSKPRLRPLSSLADRPTCWGKPVTVRCSCIKGSTVHYTWYQQISQDNIVLHHSADLVLTCGTVKRASRYYCTATNGISRQDSEIISVQVLKPGNSSCIYVLDIHGQPTYDCADRLCTTTFTAPTTFPLTTEVLSLTRNQSLQTNQTNQYLFSSRARTGMPLWYILLRWSLFGALLTYLWVFSKCSKIGHKCGKKSEK